MKKLLTTAIFSTMVLLLLGCSQGRETVIMEKDKSTYERILETGVIRAAYTVYPPSAYIDKEGKLTGTFVETLERVAKELNLTVEWTEEVGWATQIEGLNTRRYDIIGSSVWANPKRARNATLSKPLYFSPLYFYARAEDERFNELSDFEYINQSDVKISVIDGATGEVLANSQFPKSIKVPLPQLSDFSQSFLDVVHNKADVLIMEPSHALKFDQLNPNQIKNVNPDLPLRMYGNTFMFRKGENTLKFMLDTVLTGLIDTGFVDETIEKHEQFPGSFVRAPKSYIE